MAENNNKFLGRGLRYPLKPGLDGGFQKDRDSSRTVQSCIGVILGTRIGERVMLRTFGSNLYALKHEPNTPTTWAIIKDDVFRSVKAWEPRIDNLEVDVYPAPTSDPNGRFLLEIAIRYRIISTNVSDNLVYPFYLERP